MPPEVGWLPTGLDYDSLGVNHKGGQPIATSGPLISVVLTAHNEERYLAIAVNSLRVQAWQNIEIIIVNDASTDTTQKVAEELAHIDGRIKVVELPRQVGLWAAKNAGMQHCSGEFITMHDADDWSHPRKLELQVEPLLCDARLQATTSYMVRIEQDSGLPYTRNASNYLRWNPSSFMFRSGWLNEGGGFIDKLLGSDCEFISRIELRNGTKSHLRIRLPLSIGLQRGGSLSNKFRSTDGGVIRMQHWESWRKLHVRCYKSKEILKLNIKTINLIKS
jgi:glycosyltransferase involved in cell wall biosynthesis